MIYEPNQANAATPRPEPEGDSLAGRLAAQADAFAMLVTRIRAIADRLAGGVPTALKGDGGGAGAPIAMPPLSSRLRSIDESFGATYKALQEELGRLEAFI